MTTPVGGTVPPGGAAADAVLGLLRTAGLDLALPLSALREVVPCPEQLADVPVTATGLLGVMTLRSTMVPVMDLALLWGRTRERTRDQVVVVVAHDGWLVGLLVDEVRGLATVPDASLVQVAVTGADVLFTRTFHHPEQGHVVGVLDAAAVLALPGVPVVREPVAVHEAAGPSATTARTRSLTVVRCNGFSLALDVAHVHSTIPTPVLSRSAADGPTCLGMTPVASHLVGVVDLLALLGLGELAGTELECGLVLDLPAGQVVLGVSAMVGLFDVGQDRVLHLPASASPAPELLDRVADVPGVGPCLLVDGDRLKAVAAVGALSRMTTALDDADADDAPGAVTRATGPAHLSYRAGVDLATPLDQVAEVLAYPADLVPSSGAAGVLGFVVHRGTAVPVLGLADLLGRGPVQYSAASRLLLLHVDGEPVAFAVGGLHAILPLAWTDPASGRPSHDLLRACPLVQLVGTTALLPSLDLVALARARRGADHPTSIAQVPAPRSGPLSEAVSA